MRDIVIKNNTELLNSADIIGLVSEFMESEMQSLMTNDATLLNTKFAYERMAFIVHVVITKDETIFDIEERCYYKV